MNTMKIVLIALLTLGTCAFIVGLLLDFLFKKNLLARKVCGSASFFLILVVFLGAATDFGITTEERKEAFNYHAESVRTVLNGGEVVLGLNSDFAGSIVIAQREGLITKEEAASARRFEIVRIARLPHPTE
jgi:hypothetical protein